MNYSKVGSLKHNPKIRTRDGGLSVKLDNKIFWLFGDTILVNQSETKLAELSCTAGWSDPEQPFEIKDLDNGLKQFIPISGAELKISAEAWQNSGSRLAIWPMSLVAHGDKAVGLFRKLWIDEGFLNYRYVSTILASFDGKNLLIDNDTLFLGSETGLFGDAAIIDDNHLYLFGCRQNGVLLTRCKINHTNFQFWDGAQWRANTLNSKPVFAGPSSDFSVIKWQNNFLATYSVPMTNSIQLLITDGLTSPWKKLGLIKLDKPLFGNCYAAQAHPEQSEENHLRISYYRPEKILDGSLEIIEITI